MQYKNVSKKVLAFGMAFATACSAIFSMPQGVLAGTQYQPTQSAQGITVVDYKNYPNQEMAYNAAKGGRPKGDEYGFSIRGDTQFYWVTKANQASRPTSFRYNVFGWTIVVTGSNGIVGTAEYANDGGIIGYGTNTTWDKVATSQASGPRAFGKRLSPKKPISKP